MTIRKLNLLAGIAVVAVAVTGASADDKAKTQEITIGELKLTVPASWKSIKPKSSFRLGQINIPAAEGEKEGGELVVFSFGGGGGSVSQNVPRWLGEFQPKGRKATIVQGKSKRGSYVLANVTGTHVGPSFRRRPKPLENGRLVILRLVADKQKKVYYLKIAGEDKTVASVVEPLRKAIGADKKSEKPLE